MKKCILLIISIIALSSCKYDSLDSSSISSEVQSSSKVQSSDILSTHSSSSSTTQVTAVA